MIPMNEYPAGSVVPIFFATYDSNDPSASVTLTGLAVTDIEIYKGTSMTQRASDAGYALLDTDGIDLDTITGIHGFSIDLGDNTDAGFYAVGSFYTVVVSAITVDAATINFIADRFRIVAAESVAGKPKVDVDAWLGTAAATPTVAGVPEVDVTHFNGTAGTFASGRPEVNTSHVAGTAQTAGDIVGDTNDIQTRLPAALVSGRMDSSVGAMAANVLTAAAINASALNGKGDWNVGKTGYALSAAGVQAVWDALTSALTTVGSIGKKLADWVVGTIDTYTGNTPQTGDSFARIGATGSGLTSLAQASVATEARLSELDAGTAGKAAAEIDLIKADAAAILVDTGTTLDGRIPAALVGGRMDSSVGAKAVGLALTAQEKLDVNAEADTALSDYDPPTRTEATADKDELLAQLPSSPLKNTALTYGIKMVLASDHVTPATGLTITMTRNLDGAASFSAATGTVTEIASGHYKVAASAADMNGNVVMHRFTAATADDLTVEFFPVS